jgi:transcriptional regulator with XRE-family HTH domain
MKISQQLKSQRKIHDLTQQELADQLHISHQSISKWENGTALPSFANVVAIGSYFKISLDDLIKGDDALMQKFSNDKQPSTFLGILFAAVPIAIVVLLILSFAGINVSIFSDVMSAIAVIGFIGSLLTLDWSQLKTVLSTKSKIWLSIFIIALILSGIPGFINGMVSGFYKAS